ncbi:MAG TPA: zinc-ribbon domain-containing protein [Polyangiaceae bacterium]|nr:zinc-ribbon domain-containing protein [Polyangiaceae bacterium]
MNVTCTGCPAKYAVPDEKVRGKKVRITCKHCGTNIIVDGTASDEAAPKPAAQATQPKASAEAKQSAQAKAPAESMFIVGFADDRQETHPVSRIVELYSAGKIDDETLVWKDGMADWLSPFDVPELAAAFRAKNVAPRAPAATVPSFAQVEDEATLVVKSPLDDPEVAAAIAASAPSAPPAAAPAPAPVVAAPKPVEEEPAFAKPAAARRVEKRAGAVDLFGRVSEAGSEGDVSLDLGSSDERGQKLTGARNESSVLFSLDALTKPDPKANQAKAKEREREASEALFGESAPDALMNLGGSGMSAMAAPDFTKPVIPGAKVVPLNDSVEEPAPSKGKGGLIAVIALLAIAAAAGVGFVMMKKEQPKAEPAPTAPSATAQATASAAPVASEAPAASAAPSASAAAASASGTAPASSGSAAPAAASAAAVSAKPAASAAPVAAAAAKPADAAAKPADAAAAAKPADAPAAPAAAAEGAAFDKNAAVAALSAAAASAASCKTADGPTGSGKVSVTFAPSGRATATSVAGDLAGTEVGGCVARLFRAAKVPPFSGDPVTVSKSFTVQ